MKEEKSWTTSISNEVPSQNLLFMRGVTPRLFRWLLSLLFANIGQLICAHSYNMGLNTSCEFLIIY